MTDVRQKLTGLLDYVEQVIRLDERVAFRLSEYHLPDGSTFAVTKAGTQGLPSVRHDQRDEEGPLWLEVERLVRKEPPRPPDELAEWIVLSADPARSPEVRSERILTVSAAERDAALARGDVRPDDILRAPRKRGESDNAAPRFDLTLRLVDRPHIAEAVTKWIAETWTAWSVSELPRRKTIALYQVLYKIFQLMEIGGAESPIELIWGVGVVHWQKEGRIIDRPLLERRVEIELDDTRGGLIHIRPTSTDALFDLKPYEELGCENLPSLSDLIRREVQRAGTDSEGVSPFARETFEPILSAAGARLDPEGVYAPEVAPPSSSAPLHGSHLTVTDQWVLFARPRSQHVVLQDIDRLRRSAENEKRPIDGLAARLVMHPSHDAGSDGWQPLSPRIGDMPIGTETLDDTSDFGGVFFPKPFNDDQLEIVKRLSKSDGLVVQGPPGTGKTHTIANLLCHAMATGQRVLVVSRGEAALTVLKDQLPKEVQPLAISVLSNEREGLRQVESAIREIQGVVEGTRPENRRTTIARLEKELLGLQQKICVIDAELDAIALAHMSKIGPRAEMPAELAQRIVRERDAYAWFSDRPDRFAADSSITDSEISELFEARRHCGSLLDHLEAKLPSAADLPDGDALARCHEDLIAALQHQTDVAKGPARSLKVAGDNAAAAQRLADTLESLARVSEICVTSNWAEPFRVALINGHSDPWTERLRERAKEWRSAADERGALLRRPVDMPDGLVDDEEARGAVTRAASGQRLWPLVSFGKSGAKALVSRIRMDGGVVKEDDLEGWRHISSVLANLIRIREAKIHWDSFAAEIGAPHGLNAKVAVDTATRILSVCDEAHKERTVLAAMVANAFSMEEVADDPELCRSLSRQIRAALNSIRLATAQELRQRVLLAFEGEDRTSVLASTLLNDALGNPQIPADKISVTWNSVLRRLEQLKALSRDFETVNRVTAKIAAAGAPHWSHRLRVEESTPGALIEARDWRDAWDHAACDVALERIDARERLMHISKERDAAEKQCQRLFGEIVRERTFYALDSRLSPAIKAALVEFVRALARIGRGTGKTAWAHRKTARDAMARCYGAVPCWIMPTWRVAEQLPAELGLLDLVIIDEASQSDITELPALLRGKKILVVGDDRQVSPTAPFVTQEKIGQLRHHYLGDMPFKSLLEPGESIYDLMRAVFPNQRLMLKEHFRCVEPIIRFSMQFYPETMLPLRMPAAKERIDPPLIDIYVPHGARGRGKKTNPAEADVIVDEIVALTKRPEMRERTIGVISLVGKEQSEYIRLRLSEVIGEEAMQRHSLLCGDSATFQGSERDVVFLSMVADSANKTALTMLRYEQRFNVAVSRARDRVVLVRSVRREELNPNDLKARLIAHFESPMPSREEISGALSMCESNFERDLMQRLLDRGYRVQGQVGSLGYRIDMVVEGLDGTRLAIECDGDRFHGPEQWQQDMRRQRTLERVGWRFWRCFASSYYRNPDVVMHGLFEILSRLGIEPVTGGDSQHVHNRFTEHRVANPPTSAADLQTSGAIENEELAVPHATEIPGGEQKINVGDKVVLIFSDDQKRLAARLVNGNNDLQKGRISIQSPLGQAVAGAEEGDEVELPLENGIQRKILIESVERSPAQYDHSQEFNRAAV